MFYGRSISIMPTYYFIGFVQNSIKEQKFVAIPMPRSSSYIYITSQPYYPAATLISLIVSPTLALTIFLPLLGPFSLIYFLTSTKGIKYFYSLITRILLFSLRWYLLFPKIIYNSVQNFLWCLRIRAIAINANVHFALNIYIIIFFIVLTFRSHRR